MIILKSLILNQRCGFRNLRYSILNQRDPSPVFLDSVTQRILKSVTQFQLHKIFKKSNIVSYSLEYKFMTDAELEIKLKELLGIARQRLQMTPVVKVNNGTNTTISKDSPLQEFSETKYIVTDVTFGLNQSQRKIVTRQISGNLEYIPMDVAKRVNQIYFPLLGRQTRIPYMFKGQQLDQCLKEKKYEFILDRLTLQYEPYERDFHEISSKVYIHINENSDFDVLRSTRHFGPMAFFLAWNNCIDDLLYDMIKRNFYKNCVEIIALMYKLQNISHDYESILPHLEKIHTSFEPDVNDLKTFLFINCESRTNKNDMSVNNFIQDEIYKLCTDIIEFYIKFHAVKKVQLKIALKNLYDISKE